MRHRPDTVDETIAGMSTEELAALTSEQEQRLCLMAALEEGAPLPGAEVPEFTETRPSPETTVYRIPEVKTLNREVANEIVALIQRHGGELVDTTYDWNIGHWARYVKANDSEVVVGEESAFSAERFASLRQELEAFAQRKARADKERQDWKDRTKEAEAAATWVRERISDARNTVWERKRNLERFNEYLELAEGDGARAWTFFKKAGLELPGFIPDGACVAEEDVQSEDAEDGGPF